MSDVKIDIQITTDAARASVRRLLNDLREVEDVAKSTSREAGKSFKNIGDSAKKSSSTISKAFQSAGGAFNVFLGNLAANAVSAAFSGLTNAIGGAAGVALNTARDFEDLNTQLITLTGNTENANRLFNELRTFAAATPFELKGITQASTQLLAFGTELEDVVPRLQNLGDIAAATGTPLTKLSVVFGQIQAAGKLTGERLNQLQEAAVPIGPALAETLGIAESRLREFVSAGKVSAEAVAQAFSRLSAEGGIAFGGLARASLTFNGAVSTLQENAQFLVTRFAEVITGSLAVKSSIAGLSAVFEVLEQIVIENQEGLSEFVDSVANAVPSAINFLGGSIFTVIATFNALRQAYNTIIAVGATLVDSLLSVGEAALNVRLTVQNALGLDTTETQRSLDLIKGFRDSLQETAVESIEANNQIEQSTKKAFNTISDVTTQSVEAFDKAKKATLEAAAAQEEADSRAVTSKKNAVAALTAEEQKQAEQILEIKRQQAIAEDELRLLRQETESEEEALRLEKLTADLGAENAAKQLAREENAKNEFELNKLQTQAKVDAVNRDIELEKKKTAEQKKQQEARAKNFQSTLSFITSSSAAGSKELFAIQKAAAITQATIDGIAAVQKALAAAPPPFNFALAAVVGAFTAANIAQISSQSPPSFQNGGIVGGNSFSGDNINARVNSGEMILNRQQQAQLFSLANAGGGSGGQEIVVNSTVELDGEVVGRSVSRQVANGLQLGDFE